MRKRMSWFDYLNYVLMIVFSFSILYPFWNLLVVSFSYPIDAMSLDFKWFPKRFTWDSYRVIFASLDIGTGYGNTIFRTAAGTLFSVTLTLCAAYGLSHRHLPFRNVITVFFLFTMFFSGGLIPSYLLVRELGLIDSRLALIIPGAINVFNLVIIRNYIQTAIDKSFAESASIDGANDIQILFRVIAPLCSPVIATIALWTMVGHWNAWFDAMIYINSNDKQVLQTMLRKIMHTSNDETLVAARQALGIGLTDANPETLKAAFIFLTIGPIVLVYPFLQKYFVKGIMIGSLKG